MSIYIIFYGVITILYMLLVNYTFKFPVSGRKVISREEQLAKQKKVFVIVAAGLLVLIFGMRSELQGIDLNNEFGTGYVNMFRVINGDSLIEIFQNYSSYKYVNYEMGYVLFCKFLGTLVNHQQTLLVGCAFMAIVPVACFIYKHSANPWLSFVLYLALPLFATVIFSGIRQGVAIGIIVWAYGLIKEKKLIPFIVVVLLACTFHSTAIVALACYPLYHLKLEKMTAFWGGVGALLAIYILQEPLFIILARFVSSNTNMYRTNSINLFLLLSAIYATCVFFVKKEDYETRGYLNIFWLACAAQAFSKVHMLAGRITWYFMPVLIVMVPRLLKKANIKEKYILKVLPGVIGALAILLGLYYLRNNSMAMAYPYVPFWK